jgi:hypothetical protein
VQQQRPKKWHAAEFDRAQSSTKKFVTSIAGAIAKQSMHNESALKWNYCLRGYSDRRIRSGCIPQPLSGFGKPQFNAGKFTAFKKFQASGKKSNAVHALRLASMRLRDTERFTRSAANRQQSNEQRKKMDSIRARADRCRFPFCTTVTECHKLLEVSLPARAKWAYY